MQISNSENNKSFTEVLNRMDTQEVATLSDDAWIQFLLDHREMIRENSTPVQVTEEWMYRYRYRIRDYLANRNPSDATLEQAFRIVNRLFSDQDFNLSLDMIYVPDREFVVELRRRYNTITMREKKNL